ncbi:MAG: enolase C-terminal domain-like protein [Pirellulales bacterium]
MIEKAHVFDARYPFADDAGSDAVHRHPIYSYSVTILEREGRERGVGLAFTLGDGNELVCQAADYLSQSLRGRDIEEVMSDLGEWQRRTANDERYRWLGPHKGVVHLALASITNACWDLWAKSRGVPLWRLLLDLSPQEIVDTLDLSYLEDVLPRATAVEMLREQHSTRNQRLDVIDRGYPGYDTSVGWFGYEDNLLRDNCRRSVDAGFTALKLKVGSADLDRDLRRLEIVRSAAGPDVRCMVDANQQWTLAQALEFGRRARDFDLYWIEEPTHPDDLIAHRTIAEELAPVKVAAGEHVPNRVLFKNYLQMGCLGFCQVDALRVAGVSEFIAVSLLAKKFGVPVVPHVGDMGQLHQHLVLFNHVALDHEALFLEYIPHLQEHFATPCRVEDGVYRTPQESGASCDLVDLSRLVGHGAA